MSMKAEKVAQDLIRIRNLKTPIDVRAVLLDHKVFVREEAMENEMSGMLVVQGEVATAVINRDHSANRKRFTMAHELGHFLLHKDASSVFIDSSPIFYRDGQASEGVLKEEIEANAFAAELLMPAAEISARLEGRKIDLMTDESAVQKLARDLKVSVQALSIRLGTLRLVT